MRSFAYRKSLNRLVSTLTWTQQIADYLAGRGISADVARQFRLGGVPDGDPSWQPYAGMLAIPYLTPAGPVHVKFRNRTGVEPKYLCPPSAPTKMFNVMDLHKPGVRICVCEGELDTIIMSAVAGIPAVGVAGAQNWQPHYSRVLAGYSDVIVIGDNDIGKPGKDGKPTNPGEDFAKRVIKAVPSARMSMPPKGMDITDLLLAQGIDAVKALAVNAD